MSEFNEPWRQSVRESMRDIHGDFHEGGPCLNHISDCQGDRVVQVKGPRLGEKQKRVIECVNALAGLPSEKVEALAKWDLGKVLDHLNFVRSLRAYPMDRPTSDPMLLFNGVKNGVESCRKEQEA